jgi:hypothetical protein
MITLRSGLRLHLHWAGSREGALSQRSASLVSACLSHRHPQNSAAQYRFADVMADALVRRVDPAGD